MHRKILKSIGERLDDYKVTDPMRYEAAERKLGEVDLFLKKKQGSFYDVDLDKAFKEIYGE